MGTEDGHKMTAAEQAAAALTKPDHNLPRTIRARTDQTTDPVPEGKKIDAAPTHHNPLAEEDTTHQNPLQITGEELPAGQEKEAKKGHKEEMKHAHQEQTASLDKHNHGPSSTAGMRVNMQMDARRSRHGAE